MLASNPYSIYIYNHDGLPLMFLTHWDRLEYAQRLNDPWNHSIQVRLTAADPRVEILRNLERDYFVCIFRTDLATRENVLVYEGFHATSTEQVLSNGNIFFNLYGGGYTKLLERRLVIPRYGQDTNEKTGIAESVIKSFISDCLIQPFTYFTRFMEGDNKEVDTNIQNKVDEDRIMRGVALAEDKQRGPVVTYSANYVQLETAIKNCAGEVMRYGVTRGGKLGEFIFDCRPVWGQDRRIGNADGNSPVVFSLERENMLLPIFSINHRLEKNFIYVGGEGSGKERTITTVVDNAAQVSSPWSRSEAFTSTTEPEATIEQLKTVGQQYLRKNRAKITLTFGVRQTNRSRWLKEWFLGDLVTAQYAGINFDKEIEEIAIVVTGGEAAQTEELMTVTMKDV